MANFREFPEDEGGITCMLLFYPLVEGEFLKQYRPVKLLEKNSVTRPADKFLTASAGGILAHSSMFWRVLYTANVQIIPPPFAILT